MKTDHQALKMPCISETGLTVLDMVTRGDFNIPLLTKTINQDPNLAGTLIRYANSPLYRSRVEVSNVRNAISLLGFNNVRLAVMMVTMRAHGCETHSPLSDDLWDHCKTISILAKLITGKKYSRLADDIQLTSLIHDMTFYVFSISFQTYAELNARSMNDNIPLETLEMAEYGIDRKEIIAQCAQNFRLPTNLADALIGFHANRYLTRIETTADKHLILLSLAHHLEARVQSQPRIMRQVMSHTEAECMDLLDLNQADITTVLETFVEMNANQ